MKPAQQAWNDYACSRWGKDWRRDILPGVQHLARTSFMAGRRAVLSHLMEDVARWLRGIRE